MRDDSSSKLALCLASTVANVHCPSQVLGGVVSPAHIELAPLLDEYVLLQEQGYKVPLRADGRKV